MAARPAPPRRLPLLAVLLLLPLQPRRGPSSADAMLLQPANPRTSAGDTWLFLNESHINYYYLAGTDCSPTCDAHAKGWGGVGLATSRLDDPHAHFTDHGTVLL